MLSPLLLLDFDDVICINKLYGGYDVLAGEKPADFYARLFHPPAVATLLDIVAEFEPRVVVTTSWLRFLDGDGVRDLFERTGMSPVAAALHVHCEAVQDRGMTRLQAIERWLRLHHRGEPFVVLDDAESGTGLRSSALDREGRVVLCDVGVGLHAGHLPTVRRALRPEGDS